MIWKIFARLPSTRKESEDYARECYQAGVIAVGWNKLGDLNSIPSLDKLRLLLRQGWGNEAENGAKTIGQWAGALWSFRNEVKPGHYVVCPDRDSGRYYVGIIRSERVYHDKSILGGKLKFAHRRKVKWIRILNSKEVRAIWPSGQFGGNQTVSEITKGADRFKQFLARKQRTFVARPGSQFSLIWSGVRKRRHAP